jgi:hypothetical protein
MERREAAWCAKEESGHCLAPDSLGGISTGTAFTVQVVGVEKRVLDYSFEPQI